MPRREFESVVAQASREKLKQYISKPSNTIPINGSEETLIYASPSNVGRIVGMVIVMPVMSAGADGDHRFFFSYLVPDITFGQQNIDLIYGRSAPTVGISFKYNQWENASIDAFPTGSTAQAKVVDNLIFDSAIAFRMLYKLTNTVGTSSGQRQYLITYLEREVRL